MFRNFSAKVVRYVLLNQQLEKRAYVELVMSEIHVQSCLLLVANHFDTVVH
jgi:hypothetical protein